MSSDVSDVSGRDPGKRAAPPAADSPLAPPQGVDEVVLDPRIDKLIGRTLEAHYSDLVAAPLPDAILVLLAQLEATEKGK